MNEYLRSRWHGDPGGGSSVPPVVCSIFFCAIFVILPSGRSPFLVSASVQRHPVPHVSGPASFDIQAHTPLFFSDRKGAILRHAHHADIPPAPGERFDVGGQALADSQTVSALDLTATAKGSLRDFMPSSVARPPLKLRLPAKEAPSPGDDAKVQLEPGRSSFVQTRAWITQDYLKNEFFRKVYEQRRAREEREQREAEAGDSNSDVRPEEASKIRDNAHTHTEELDAWDGSGQRSWRSVFEGRRVRAEPVQPQTTAGASQGQQRGGRDDALAAQTEETRDESSSQEVIDTSGEVAGASEAEAPQLTGASFLESDSVRVPSLSGHPLPPAQGYEQSVQSHNSLSESTSWLSHPAPPSPRSSDGPYAPSASSLMTPSSASPAASAHVRSPSPAVPQPPSALALRRPSSARSARALSFESHASPSAAPGAAAPQQRRTPSATRPLSHLQVKSQTQIIEALLSTALSTGAAALSQGAGLPATGGIPMNQITMAGMQPTMLAGAGYAAPVPYGMPVDEGLSTTEITLIVLGVVVGLSMFAGLLYISLSAGGRRRRR
ncbi:hypothetical protein BESB_071730 [Besnoitia besnoiti]|uniref:Transmembrane protein n=1 Tax=Besnoitia besnoiti TaxID=94643 RepID=A0A2A9MCH7_BESBE|nr:uncharacterized protein BESB_071730 [Besnoitia besnoiti]PFH34021.1 hypothetical protein BESB_071730 [Besnoitia besnoiti]